MIMIIIKIIIIIEKNKLPSHEVVFMPRGRQLDRISNIENYYH